MKSMIVVHSSTYEGNPRTGAHIAAELDHKHEMCEMRMSLHFSHTPGHPAAVALGKALSVFQAAIDMEEHIRKAHFDGSICPIAAHYPGKDWGDLENLPDNLRCDREA